MKIWILITAFPLLTACSLGFHFIKEGTAELTSHYGFQRATIIVEVPANFSASYKAYYRPRTPEECQFYGVGTGGYYTHIGKKKTDNFEASLFEQTIKFKVPLTYHLGLCTMNLTALTTSIKSSNKEGDSAGLTITSSPSKPTKQPATEKLVRRLCGPVLHVIPEHAELKKLSVYLKCRSADQHWQLPEEISDQYDTNIAISMEELKSTPVRYIYRKTANVRPLIQDNWRKFDSGWKPCVANSKWLGEERCAFRDPKFTKFLMSDGRVCTIYPGCTE